MGGSAGETDGVGKIEIERKYAVGAGFAMPDLSGAPLVATVTSPRTYQLTAVYYDTPEFGLAVAKITLRRRTGGTDAGWHLKLPAGAARREVHAPLGPGDEPVPGQLSSLVPGWTAERPLRPVARLQTARTVRHLLDGDGRVLAEVADDQVTGLVPGPDGSWQRSSAWREVEVELAGGDPGLLDAAGGLLLAAGAEPSRSASKLSQVLTAAGSLPTTKN
jgi:inorganic triphosphatase YgiF